MILILLVLLSLGRIINCSDDIVKCLKKAYFKPKSINNDIPLRTSITDDLQEHYNTLLTKTDHYRMMARTKAQYF